MAGEPYTSLVRWSGLVALLLLLACRGSETPLMLATTTSIGSSGLLEALLPKYAAQTVRTVQVGSGRALAMLAAGQADVVVSHAPQREAEVLHSHPTWFYRKILHNDFLIVGPPEDPATLAGMTNAAAAMNKIINSGQRFISRGDESGTHEREQQLWAAARLEPVPAQIVSAGAGMAQTLRIASETKSYTLTDRATFEMLSASLQLRGLVAGGPELLNTYGVIADPANDAGIRFAKWLAEGDGRRALAVLLSSGAVRGFSLWPGDRSGTTPTARPF